MKRIQIQSLHARNIAIQHKGFTLIESLVAMLMLLGALGGLVPVFMSYRLAAIDNQIKTGAIAVAQAELDEIRQTDFQYLPVGTATTVENGTANFMGKTYDKVTTYCSATAPTACDDDTRTLHVEVRYNNRQILEVETVYTDLSQ